MSKKNIMQKQHLLIIDGAIFGDVLGGSYRFSYDAARMLAKRGWQVTLLAPDVCNTGLSHTSLGNLNLERYPYHSIKLSSIFGNWFLLYETIRVIRKLKKCLPVDLIWVHTSIAASAIFLAHWHIPVIWTIHGPAVAEAEARGHINLFKRYMMLFIEYIGAIRANRITFASEYMRDACLKEFGGINWSNKISVIPLGVNAYKIANILDSYQRPRQSDKIELVTVRRLDPRMGLDNLVVAVQLLHQRGYNVNLNIVGVGPDRSRLINLINKKNLKSSIHLWGKLNDEKIYELYSRSHIAILPSLALEGFGLSMIEAMAAGLPVIVTPVGAMPSIIGNTFPQLVAGGIGPLDIADAILSIANLNENDYRKLCQNIQSFALQFDWDLIIKYYEHLLNQTVDII